MAETEFTLNLANNTEFVSGVVGWVEFDKASVKDDIDRLYENTYLKGFRPMFHDILDNNLPIITDHIAKPKVVNGEIYYWMKDKKELSNLDNVYCKFLGIVTEVEEG